MTDKEKAEKITIKIEGEIGTSSHSRQAIEESLLEMAEWKDSQLKPTLMQFFKYLDKRGFLDPELQCDPEHQIDTFLEQFNNDVEID